MQKGLDDESSKKMELVYDSDDCSIRVINLDILFYTSNTAIWNRKYPHVK